MIIGATTTWNNRDVVEQCLRHYKSIGMDQLLVMDFDSVDGTQDILRAQEWSGFVELIPFPGIKNLDSSNLFLELAKDRFPGDAFILFFDPDEFLITPKMNIRDALRNGDEESGAGSVIRRFNVTASKADALESQDRMHPFGSLVYQILDRKKRKGLEEMHHDRLDPPWIWSAIPGKVLVKIDNTVAIGDGDHNVRLRVGEQEDAGSEVYLLHFPFRSWREFREKIDMARIDMAANAAQLPENYGWQIKRWIRLAEEERLHEEYMDQFIDADELDRMLAAGAVTKNERLAAFHTAGD